MRTQWTAVLATGALVAGVLLVTAPVRADRPQLPQAAGERLRGLSTKDLARLEPHLAAGPVALIEFANTDKDRLPAINIATYVNAPVPAIVDVIGRPEHYPSFIGTADEVNVVARERDTVVYDWNWGMAIFQMEGRNVMRTYLPAAAQASRGARITIDSQSGDMGKGRTSIRVLPRDLPATAQRSARARSLLVLSMRVDLRDANYVARKLSQAARSINRSANISLAYSLLLGYQAQAERRSGKRAAARVDAGFARPQINLRALYPLLRRGDLLMLELERGALRQVAVVGGIGKRPEVVREILLDAHGFGRSLLPGSEATVVSQQGPTTVFDWDIDLPLIGVSGRMRMDERPDEIAVQATGGALAGGRWSFAVEPLGKRGSVVTSWARFDLKRSSWWLKQLVDDDPVLGHGISAASEVMLMRALRSRSRKVDKHGKPLPAAAAPKVKRKRVRLKAHRRHSARFGR